MNKQHIEHASIELIEKMSSLEAKITALEDEIAELQAERRAATTPEERIVLGNMITAARNQQTELMRLSGNFTAFYIFL